MARLAAHRALSVDEILKNANGYGLRVAHWAPVCAAGAPAGAPPRVIIFWKMAVVAPSAPAFHGSRRRIACLVRRRPAAAAPFPRKGRKKDSRMLTHTGTTDNHLTTKFMMQKNKTVLTDGVTVKGSMLQI